MSFDRCKVVKRFSRAARTRCLTQRLRSRQGSVSRSASCEKKLIAEGKRAGDKRKSFIYVNNRLEGNALETISAMIEAVGAGKVPAATS